MCSQCKTCESSARIRVSFSIRAFHIKLEQYGRTPAGLSFGLDTIRRRSLLSHVYARGSKISHTGGTCVLPGQ